MRSPLILVGSLFCLTLAYGEAAPLNYDGAMREARDLCDHDQYERAATLLENLAASASKENERVREASILALLGSVYEHSGKYEQAEQALNRSVYYWTQLEGPGSANLLGPLQDLGQLYYIAGQISLAQRLLERALAIELASGAHADSVAALLTILGNVHLLQHKTALAQRNAEDALKYIAVSDNSRQAGGAAYTLLGAIYFESGEAGKAESCLQQALAIWQSKRGEQDVYVAEGTANLAIFYSAAGQHEKAEKLFPRADEMLERAGGKASYFRLKFLAEYAGFERKTGHKKEARQLSKQAEMLLAASAENAISRHVIDASTLPVAR